MDDDERKNKAQSTVSTIRPICLHQGNINKLNSNTEDYPRRRKIISKTELTTSVQENKSQNTHKNKINKKHLRRDSNPQSPASTRSADPAFRRPMPYPLGHGGSDIAGLKLVHIVKCSRWRLLIQNGNSRLTSGI